MKLYSKIPWLISMMLGASSVNAIEISPDDRGQLLIAPVYQASEGKSTEIRVVNPSKTAFDLQQIPWKFSISIFT